MSEEERTSHAEMIEEIMTRKMKPIYWSLGISLGLILTIFMGVSGPITAELMDMKVKVSGTITSEEVYKNFLPKLQYHQLQKDEHEVDCEAIRHPSDANFLYLKHNSSEADRLDIRYRGN